jgi:hypothetical protein
MLVNARLCAQSGLRTLVKTIIENQVAIIQHGVTEFFMKIKNPDDVIT